MRTPGGGAECTGHFAARQALFWLTRWGRSQLEAHTVNEAQLLRALADALLAENARLRADVDSLMRHGAFGCANDPILDPGRLLSARAS